MCFCREAPKRDGRHVLTTGNVKYLLADEVIE